MGWGMDSERGAKRVRWDEDSFSLCMNDGIRDEKKQGKRST